MLLLLLLVELLVSANGRRRFIDIDSQSSMKWLAMDHLDLLPFNKRKERFEIEEH